jgi:hypothetical protein
MARAIRALTLLVVVGLVVWWSASASTPKDLPGASFGWAPLFYIERAGALLGAVGIVLLVGWRALHGRFPIRVGNIEYEELRASTKTVESHEKRLRLLEDYLELADEDDG